MPMIGIRPTTIPKLTKMWKLPAGAAYDNSYASDFIFKEIMPLVPRGTKPPAARESGDSEKHVVNVTIVFER